MRKFLLNLCLLIVLTFLTSCSKNESVVGTWELTSWSIQIPMNLNNDSTSSINLLDEASCKNEELLKFESNGTVSSNMTYNPQVTVSVSGGTQPVYNFNIKCDQVGGIGAAGEFAQDYNSVSLFNQTGIVSGNRLTIVHKYAIDIYNKDLTEVVAKKDLTLIYIKK